MAESDYILDVEGVKGEYQDKQGGGTYDDKIRVESWSWGCMNPGTYGEGTSGGGARGTPEDLIVNKFYDCASAELMKKSLTGETTPKVTLIERTWHGPDSALETLKVELTDVVMAGVSMSGSDGGAMETLTFNFRKLKVTYTPQKDDGSPGTPVPFEFERTG